MLFAGCQYDGSLVRIGLKRVNGSHQRIVCLLWHVMLRQKFLIIGLSGFLMGGEKLSPKTHWRNIFPGFKKSRMNANEKSHRIWIVSHVRWDFNMHRLFTDYQNALYLLRTGDRACCYIFIFRRMGRLIL